MDIITLQKITENFARELESANLGEKNSLAYIIHELSPSPLVRDNEVFESMVIGGTIGKIAIFKKIGKRIQIISQKEKNLSIKTAEEFFDFINKNLAEDIAYLAVNLAYPIRPIFADGILDGILLAVTKEGGFNNLVGKQIGKEIEKYIFQKKNKKIRVAVANDTVCLLTSGLEKFQEKELAAGIVGTGFNIAFFTNTNELVNLESANFDKFPQTKSGQKVDEKSARPGTYLFEKEVAGAYLYQHFNYILKEKKINFPVISSTEELDKISRTNIPNVSKIAQDLLTQSAQLVACQIAGTAEFKKRNMTFIMEGSLFWKGNGYKETVIKTVKQLVPKYKINFIEIKDSTILGAAKLVS